MRFTEHSLFSNGKPAEPWRINLMPLGDRVRVEVGFDAEYRNGPQHPIPAWFKALQTHPQALKYWEALIPSRKKEILRYFVA